MTRSRRTRASEIALLAGGLTGWIFCFVLSTQAFAVLASDTEVKLLLGVPVAVFGVALFMVPLVLGAAGLARRRRPTAIARRAQSPTMGIALLIFSVIGWYAAFTLTVDKVRTALEPSVDLDCNFSLLVQCGTNLQSWQGSLFGFPNPLIGVAGWIAVMVVGVLVLAGVRLKRWFWVLFSIGVAAALALVIWLIVQSIFDLGTLCPWCMVTWAVTIPLFWIVVLDTAKRGEFGRTVKRVFGPAYNWVPLITAASYFAIVVIAQLRLDVLTYL